MHESLGFKESLTIKEEKITLPSHSSGRMIGEVTLTEKDKNGNVVSTETTYNDITLPGCVFILEQLFNVLANNDDSKRYKHTTTVPVGKYGDTTTATLNTYSTSQYTTTKASLPTKDELVQEYVFGFMVGNGGEDSNAVISPRFESTYIEDATSSSHNSSFLPLRKVSTGVNVDGDSEKYYMKTSVSGVGTSTGYDYYYAKSFLNPPTIVISRLDGNDVGEASESPVVTYARMQFTINNTDLREYFADKTSESCYINQIGLVGGFPIRKEIGGVDTTVDFTDIRLITTLNFLKKDLTNNENSITFTYKMYCL